MNSKVFLKPCPACKEKRADTERVLNDTELLRCVRCGFVYANLEDERIKEVNFNYDEEAIAKYKERQTFIDSLWFKSIVKRLSNMAGKGKVLDVGCGNGTLLKYFVDQKWEAYGIDASPWAKEFAQKYGYTLYSGELEKSGLPENHFDVITSTSTLEHIVQPYQHVKEIMRALKPGGIAYFSGIPNYGSLAIKLNMSSFYHNTPPGHANYFTHKSIRWLFSNTDIAESVKKLSITSYGIPESHRLYFIIREFTRKRTGKPAPEEKDVSGKAAETASQKILAAVLIAIYYNLGRLFYLGDRLEVIAIKRD
ncbi:MAG: class I SAM-dependent methyltransferase [Candidatus Omnitrophota bacterium]